MLATLISWTSEDKKSQPRSGRRDPACIQGAAGRHRGQEQGAPGRHVLVPVKNLDRLIKPRQIVDIADVNAREVLRKIRSGFPA
jgi:hypothetical protein